MNKKIWHQIIDNLPLPCQSLCYDHCVLLQVYSQENKATCVFGIKNEALIPFFNKRLPDLERSIFKVMGKPPEITFQLIDTATFN